MPSSTMIVAPVDGHASLLAGPTPHRQPGTRTGYIGIADSLRIVRRRRWLILLVLATIVLLTLIFLARTQPIYSTTTTVMVLPTNQSTTTSATPTVTPTATDDAAIQTKVELLQSRSIARQMVQSLQLSNDPEFASGASGPSWSDQLFDLLTPSAPSSLDPKEVAQANDRARTEAITDRLMDHISVSRIARSNVISVTASSVDPVKAARIANRLVDTYIGDQLDDANQSRQQDIQALSKRVADVRGYLERADTNATDYRRAHGLLTTTPEDTGNIQSTQLSGLLAQARADAASDTRKAAPVTMAGGGISASSTLLTELQQQEAVLARKMGELTSFYGPGYPDVVKTSAELNALRTRIASETERVRADLRDQASASQAKSATIGAALAGVRSQSFGQGKVAVPLRALERNVEAVNTLYTSLVAQLNAKLGTPLDVNPDISRISRAPVVDQPSYPLPKRVLAVAVLAAIGLGTLLAFVIETMDTRLRTAEQVSRLLGIPTLAMVPELEDRDGPIHGAVAGRPRSRFAEAMRNLLIELESRIGTDGSKVVVVTSPLEDEGKNTIATSLAAAAGVIGLRAVIVDLDLRRPGLVGIRQTDPAGGAGVVAYLAQRARVDELVTADDDEQFAVIGVGEMAADPGALIASQRLPELLAQLRERYELVILNAPPILPVRDAKTLSEHADATLLVLRWGKTSPEAAAAAMEIFGRPITGAVINRVDYAVHASRRYGDAIHHVARSMAYYDQEPQAPRWPWQRASRWVRRAIGRTTEALHLA